MTSATRPSGGKIIYGTTGEVGREVGPGRDGEFVQNTKASQTSQVSLKYPRN